MDTKEIKLRLVEAFIAQNTHPDIMPEYVDKLLEYINFNNETQEKIDNFLENHFSEEENLRNIYFSFYDQMDEPERSEAKENWKKSEYTDIQNISESINGGFGRFDTKQGSPY